MVGDLISKPTRSAFRDVLVDVFTLQGIKTIFDDGELTPNKDYKLNVSGEPRGLVESYYANLNFSSPSDIKKLVAVYAGAILRLKRLLNSNPYARGSSPLDERSRINSLLARMQQDGFQHEDGRFISDKLHVLLANTPILLSLTEESIQEHIKKAHEKITEGDLSGAITNAYTLVEAFLKNLLNITATPFTKSEGDIVALYKLLATPLNLTAKNDSLESYIKGILSGLISQISGLKEVANKASDRHARCYNPHPHHAKLAVNAAFTLCEFLLESYEYQKKMPKKNETSSA